MMYDWSMESNYSTLVNSARPIPVQEHRAFGERSFLKDPSVLTARSQPRSLLPSTGKLQFPRPLPLTRHSSLPRKAGSSGESLKGSLTDVVCARVGGDQLCPRQMVYCG